MEKMVMEKMEWRRWNGNEDGDGEYGMDMMMMEKE